jgi:hypothetical protein
LAVEQIEDSSYASSALLNVDEQGFRIEPAGRWREFHMQASMDPAGRFFVLGSGLFLADLSAPGTEDEFGETDGLREFAGGSVAIHPTLDLVVSMRGAASPVLYFQTFTGPVNLAEKTLEYSETARDEMEALFDKDPDVWFRRKTLVFDAPRNRVFCGWWKWAWVVDLASLDLDVSPLVLIDAPDRVTASTGEQVAVPLKLSNPDLEPKAKYELVSGPPGAKIDSGKLVWKPTANDVGVHPIEVRAEAGGSTDTLTMTVAVRRPAVDLGFHAAAMVVGPDGSRALLLGGDPEGSRLSDWDLQRQSPARRVRTRTVSTCRNAASAVAFMASRG